MSTSATIEGQLTADPELRFTPGGKPVCDFSVAVNRSWDGDKGKQEEVSFFQCVAWQDVAEHMAESLHKGDRVVVIGRLKQERWEAEDGSARSKIAIVVDSIGPSLRFANAQVLKDKSDRKARPEDEDPF